MTLLLYFMMCFIDKFFQTTSIKILSNNMNKYIPKMFLLICIKREAAAFPIFFVTFRLTPILSNNLRDELFLPINVLDKLHLCKIEMRNHLLNNQMSRRWLQTSSRLRLPGCINLDRLICRNSLFLFHK